MPRRIAPGQVLGAIVGVALLGLIAWWIVLTVRKPHSESAKLIVGTNDEVYYFQPVTPSNAASLGQALQTAGYFTGRGASVQLMKWRGATTVSFALNDGAWTRPLTVRAFEEIGRRVAPVIGGYPIQVNLTDAQWIAHKSLGVGKVTVGANDVIYYLGDATDADARALGAALRDAGYLKGLGVSVTLAKDPHTSIGFVVTTAVWGQTDLTRAFEKLTREVEASVGGGPIELRLLDANMDEKKSLLVP